MSYIRIYFQQELIVFIGLVFEFNKFMLLTYNYINE